MFNVNCLGERGLWVVWLSYAEPCSSASLWHSSSETAKNDTPAESFPFIFTRTFSPHKFSSRAIHTQQFIHTLKMKNCYYLPSF